MSPGQGPIPKGGSDQPRARQDLRERGLPEAIGLEVPGESDNATADVDGWSSHRIEAGGLLLLLRPLIDQVQEEGLEHLSGLLGDLALVALRRCLQPLPVAERQVVQERQRPLLVLLAPDRDWEGPIGEAPLLQGEAAEALLARVVERIPPEVAFAPGAARQVMGSASPSFPSREDSLLARVLLRPGALNLTDWEAELVWPLASADLALRRIAWDLDPGWIPWLGRVIRFRYADR